MKNVEFSSMDQILIRHLAFPLQKHVPKGATKVHYAIIGGGGKAATQDFVLLSQLYLTQKLTLAIFLVKSLAEALWWANAELK